MESGYIFFCLLQGITLVLYLQIPPISGTVCNCRCTSSSSGSRNEPRYGYEQPPTEPDDRTAGAGAGESVAPKTGETVGPEAGDPAGPETSDRAGPEAGDHAGPETTGDNAGPTSGDLPAAGKSEGGESEGRTNRRSKEYCKKECDRYNNHFTKCIYAGGPESLCIRRCNIYNNLYLKCINGWHIQG